MLTTTLNHRDFTWTKKNPKQLMCILTHLSIIPELLCNLRQTEWEKLAYSLCKIVIFSVKHRLKIASYCRGAWV